MFFKSWNAQFALCQRNGSLTRRLSSAGQAENRRRRLRPELAACACAIWSAGLPARGLGAEVQPPVLSRRNAVHRGHGRSLRPAEADTETVQ